jgi:hypothetical protein
MVLRGFLKFMAGFLAVLLILGMVLGAAGYFAIRNLNPNMFRSEIEKYITLQTGFRAELGDIKFRWSPQPQLQVAGLKFYHPQSLEKLLQSDQVRIDANLPALWQKNLQMSEVVIQSPEIFLKRDPKGVWNWEVAKEPATSAPVAAPLLAQSNWIPSAEASEGTGTLSPKSLDRLTQGWKFGIGKILVRDATVHFEDQTVDPAYKLEIAKLEIEVQQKNPASPFHFTAGGTLFNSSKRNLEAEGDLDLAARSLDLMLRYGPEKAVFKGVLKMIDTTPQFQGTLEVLDLEIEPLIPATYKEGDYLTGRLSAKAQLAFDGANPDRIQRSLAGQGTIEVRDGALKNRNLIKEVFDRLSPVLALTNALGGELPPEVSDMLKGRDTPFESLQVVYGVQAGIVKINEFRLMHPNYQLSGQGTYGLLNKRVDGFLQLFLSKSISAYLMKKIREMEMIADSNGQIVIPFRYSGIFPNASVQPDLNSIGSKLLQAGTEQLLGRGIGQLSKRLGGKKIGFAAPSEPASPKNQWLQQGLALLSTIQETEKK